MPWLPPTIRLAYRDPAVKIVPLGTLQIYVHWDRCAQCHGSGRTLADKPKRRRR